MITRFYVDNYKCLVNFEYKPQPLELIIGANGSGKSTVFEALTALRDFVIGRASVDECFPASTLTRWQNSPFQTFKIGFQVDNVYGDENYEKEELFYEISIEHGPKNRKSHLFHESLSNSNGSDFKPLFFFLSGESHIFWDDNSGGPQFPSDSSHSALANVPSLRDTQRLDLFREQLGALLLIHLNPMAMDHATEEETSDAKRDFSNFASWYRHFSQEQPQETNELFADLREVLEDFEYLQLSSTGSDRRELRMKSKGGKDAPFYRFDELSDGQRALIVLYSVLHFAVGQGATVCIDEPENFVALRELQPFLLSIEEKIEESSGQVLLISHGSEFINRMPVHSTVVFERPKSKQVQIVPFSMNGITALSPAEIVARGWESNGSDKVVVICEDVMQEKPIRAWLKLLGYNTRREVVFRTHPEAALGHKRNNAWVEQKYVEEVQAHRERVHRMQCALIVCRDGDEKSVEEHERTFAKRLADASLDKRAADESIALLIPRRNIETWLAFLADYDVNENDDYKAQCRTIDVNESARRFARLACSAPMQPDHCPSALKVALESECPRIQKR